MFDLNKTTAFVHFLLFLLFIFLYKVI